MSNPMLRAMSTGAGPAFSGEVTITDQTLYDANFNPNTAFVSYTLGTDGVLTVVDTDGSATPAGEWAVGAADPSLYDVYFEQISGDAPTSGSSALDTWLSLGTERNIRMSQTGTGSRNGRIQVTIRLNSSGIAQDTAEVLLSAVVLAL